MREYTLGLLISVSASACLWAHPVPKENHDRTIVVHLTTDAVTVDYRVELDTYRMYRDLEGVDLKRGANEDIHDAYLRYWAPYLMGNLIVTFEGKELELRCLSKSIRVLDHVRCDYRFQARWKLSETGAYAFTFQDANFHGDLNSVVHLSFDSSPELTLTDVVAPEDDLLRRAPDQLRPGDRDRLKTLRATVRAVPSFHAGLVRPALPPDPDPVRPPAVGRARLRAGLTKPILSEGVGRVRTVPPPEEQSGPSRQRWLDLLFDTRKGSLVLLLLFAGFGAGHALTPGHGKTLVAAYLVGAQGTVWHALLLGVVTTLTHTAIVMVLALALPWIFPHAPAVTLQAILGLGGGLLIAGVGCWLLMQRLAGQADHVHLGGGHGHSHGEGGEEKSVLQPRSPGSWGIILLGISGGLVPCWDALLIPAVCISAQRPELAWPLVLSFSAGLASVLVMLGILVVRARDLAGGLLHDRRIDLVARALPIVSALVIVVLGLWMCYESSQLVI